MYFYSSIANQTLEYIFEKASEKYNSNLYEESLVEKAVGIANRLRQKKCAKNNL